MGESGRLLKECIAEACRDTRTPFGRFAALVGLQDFMLEMSDLPRDANEIAACALDQLCAKENGATDPVLCLAVVRFLDQVHGAPSQDPGYQRLKDLRDVLNSPGTYEAFLRWAESWYGK